MDIAKELWDMRVFNLEIKCQCKGKSELRPEDEYLIYVNAEQDFRDDNDYHSTFKHWFEAATFEDAMKELKRRCDITMQINHSKVQEEK